MRRISANLLIWIYCGAFACALPAAKNARAPRSADGRSAAVNSEQQLIERRKTRLKQLAAPPIPPTLELPKSVKKRARTSLPLPSGEGTRLSPIDRFIYSSWQKADLPEAAQPPELCDDAAFCRRAYLDLIGVIPTGVELNRFIADRSPQKREKLVEQLLARDDDYAAHFTSFWEDALASQPVLSQGGIPTRGNYREWIYDSLKQNHPYDVMTAELIDPTMPRRHGAVTEDLFGVKYTIEYVRNEDHTVTLQTAANIGQVFLGTSMKCASCHDHFDNPEWTQQRFVGFASLFAPADLELLRCDVHLGKTAPARFPIEFPGAEREVPSDLNGRLHLTAQLITDPLNTRFAETIVNRLWKRYLGLGLIEPVDDFRSTRPASHPELLTWLAYDFVAHGCDLKHTINEILTSRTYQHCYDSGLEDHFDSTGAETPRYFRSPALRRLTAEQILDSLPVALGGALDPRQRCYLDGRATALMRALGRPDSRNEISTSRSDDFGVVSALELLNGPELHALLEEAALPIKPAVRRDPRRLVDQLYLSVLSRHASSEERKLAGEWFSQEESLEEAGRDLLWALICSPEFQYIQ